jgi:hypothetical protein
MRVGWKVRTKNNTLALHRESKLLDISLLNITQNLLRDINQISEMVDFVKSGGKFTRDSISEYHNKSGINNGYVDLIEIARFEDGKLFVRNGHHRAVAIYLGGRNEIDESEYHITDWKYSDFSDINFTTGWVTPFNVATHVRISDLANFKRNVGGILRYCGPDAARQFIRENSKLYCEQKEFEGIIALAERINNAVHSYPSDFCKC